MMSPRMPRRRRGGGRDDDGYDDADEPAFEDDGSVFSPVADDPYHDDEPHTPAVGRRPFRLPLIDRNLASRTLVAVPGIFVAILVVYAGGFLFMAALAVLACLALLEFYSLTAATRPLRWAGYLGSLTMIFLAWNHDNPPYGVLHGMAIGAGFIALAALTVGRIEDITARVSTTALGMGYIGFAFAMLMALRELPHGGGAVANVLVGVWVFDTASYFGGKLRGTIPVAPRISPGKTLEGLITGLVVGVLAVVVSGLYMDWIDAFQSLVLGVVICVASYMGDLFESALKRDAGAKDSGRLLPGHGGVLDRFDALMFASVAAYFTTVALIH